MKILHSRIISFFIVITLFVTMNMFAASSYAAISGAGSADNPYLISEASDLQNINNNVSAHYKLAADIDLSGADFTPIGNVDSGAFSGSFDGNGYTIRNLKVDSGKYAGLFGCNEGEIKNVVLENADITGTRYVGGVAGYNTENGSIADCKVNSGKINGSESINSISVGGICGYNKGTITGSFKNNSSISASSQENLNVGGVIGYNTGSTSISNSDNSGDIYIRGYYSFAGGIIGYCSGTTILDGCKNTGNITGKYFEYSIHLSRAGGIIGYSTNKISIKNSINSGIINVDMRGSWDSGGGLENNIGGIAGECVNCEGTIYNCSNTGGLFGYNFKSGDENYLGGIVGRCSGTSGTVNISHCYNSANIYSSAVDCRSGGIIGSLDDYYDYGNSVIISNCYNSGNVEANGDQYNEDIGGIAGGNSSNRSHKITSCYNTGNLITRNSSRPANGVGSNSVNSYSLQTYAAARSGYTDADMKNRTTYNGWNFETIWQINENNNSGYPYFADCDNPIMNYSNRILKVGDTLQLKAMNVSGGEIEWYVAYGESALVDSNGLVTCIQSGAATVTAEDNEGNKVNCNIYVLPNTTSATLQDFSVSVRDYEEKHIMMKPSGDYVVNVISENPEIVKAEIYTSSSIYLTTLKTGTSRITFTTAVGTTGSCTVTVTNEAESIKLSSASATIAKGNTKQLTATTTPSPTSSAVTWSSSDSSVASVDQNGLITAVGTGSATITVKTDNGYSASCSVTVNDPVKSMAFVQQEATVYKGDTVNLDLAVSPAETTDSISYSSYSTSYATCSNGTKTGVTVTGVNPGSSTITATASSGVKATCKVKVIDYPVIVTGVSLNETEHSLKVGEMFNLDAAVTPSNATNQNITWASTDDTVATVNQNGIVTAAGAGKAVITAASDNGVIASCEVTVSGVASTNISKIYVPKILATEEEYIDVPVMLENNPGINFASIKVIYDSSNMTAESVSNGTVFDSVMGSIDNDNSLVKLNFTSNENKTEDGVLAMIRFKVAPLQEAQSYSVKVGYYPGEIRNGSSEAVAFNLSDGLLDVPACSHPSAEVINEREASCTAAGYTGDTCCTRCKFVLKTGEVIPQKEHQWETVTDKKASYGESGVKSLHCAICNAIDESSRQTINKISSVTLSTTAYAYNGYTKTPAVTVKDSAGRVLKKDTDYTVSYASGRVKVGRYAVKVTFKGNYTGSRTLYFTIGPKNPTTVSTKLYGYDDVKVSYSDVSGESGYAVYYKKSTSSTYTLYKRTTAHYANIANLYDGTKYYFKVVPYKIVNGYRCYSSGKTSSIYTLKKISTPVVGKYSSSKVKVSWINIYGESGYQISKSTRKTGTNIVYTYRTTTGKSKVISATKGKTYYYKVRAYRTIGTKRIYGPWSYVKAYRLR